MAPKAIRRGTRIGKYRLLEPLGSGGFAKVYRARDEIEGRDVALKIPHAHLLEDELEDLLREVRITVRLEHPNILPILNADLVDGCLIIAHPLAKETLASRLQRRLSGTKALAIVEQVLEATAYAHERRVIHCDINPDNVLLFEDGTAKLADFGIARIALKTRVIGSGSGTVGYVAPEQALGRPSFRSDVFSLGLLIYRLFSGELPRWPYEWPPPGHGKLRRRLTPEMVQLVRKAITVDERKRYPNALRMLQAYERIGEVLR